MSEARTRARARAVYLTYRTLGEAMQRIPEPVVAAIAATVGEAMSVRKNETRLMADRHLYRMLKSGSPDVEPDPELLRRWTRRYYRSYARYWMEGARISSVPVSEIAQRMLFERGYEHLKTGMATGKGVVMALPHIGSWEWGGRWLAYDGTPMTSVAERIDPPELFDYFIAERQAMGLNIVPLGDDSGKAVLSTLRAGGLVGLVCDRDIVGNGVEVEFFGETTTFPPGPATLALRTGATLLVAVVYSGPGKDHTGVISPPVDTSRTKSLRHDVARVTQQIATQLEWYIRRTPEQWHVFQPNWPSDHQALAQARAKAKAKAAAPTSTRAPAQAVDKPRT